MASSSRRKRRGSFRVNARGWVFLVLTGSVAFAAGFKGNNLLFAVFCVLLGVFSVSGLLTWLVGRGMEVTRVLPARAVAGEPLTWTLRFRNGKSFWPAFCLKFEDRLGYEGRATPLQPAPSWVPLLGARRRARVPCSIVAPQRGWARLGPVRLTSEFSPGLFTYQTVIPVTDPILVYPRMGVLNRRLLDERLARAEANELVSAAYGRGEEEFAGVREYRPGDHPRRIHWKMSARVPDRLLVREFEDPLVRDALILLETFLPNPNDSRRRARLERAVSFAATLAEGLLADQYRVRFRAFAPDPVEVRLAPGRAALDDLLFVLAELKPTRVRQLAELLAAEEGGRNEVTLILRTGEEPLPPGEPLRRSLVIDASEMKELAP